MAAQIDFPHILFDEPKWKVLQLKHTRSKANHILQWKQYNMHTAHIIVPFRIYMHELKCSYRVYPFILSTYIYVYNIRIQHIHFQLYGGLYVYKRMQYNTKLLTDLFISRIIYLCVKRIKIVEFSLKHRMNC